MNQFWNLTIAIAKKRGMLWNSCIKIWWDKLCLQIKTRCSLVLSLRLEKSRNNSFKRRPVFKGNSVMHYSGEDGTFMQSKDSYNVWIGIHLQCFKSINSSRSKYNQQIFTDEEHCTITSNEKSIFIVHCCKFDTIKDQIFPNSRRGPTNASNSIALNSRATYALWKIFVHHSKASIGVSWNFMFL